VTYIFIINIYILWSNILQLDGWCAPVPINKTANCFVRIVISINFTLIMVVSKFCLDSWSNDYRIGKLAVKVHESNASRNVKPKINVTNQRVTILNTLFACGSRTGLLDNLHFSCSLCLAVHIHLAWRGDSTIPLVSVLWVCCMTEMDYT
jgi:hypothetical protein